MKNKTLMLVPFIIFAVLCVFLLKGLFGNPKEIETGRIGHTMPTFSLPDLMDENKRWSDKDLLGEVYLLNVWGTWCPTC